MVKKLVEDSERILGYLGECPGAAAGEIAEALGMEAGEAQRALRRLEGRNWSSASPDRMRPTGEATPGTRSRPVENNLDRSIIPFGGVSGIQQL